ncbi:membrane protein [Desulfuromonas versatilis]|uniref:Membrane protein n=1 Tax=Desulfuromonas versatilis TaxID=2802975 RepID=A0ABM8HTN4_9BACT|nr:YedE family putative selenium transporter [Desulfuromonas versatilis]BCR05341.1 membrane protein [Desulfuromonas versatilis]
MNWRETHSWTVVAAGLLLGGLGVLLAVWGNPENSGICVSCFIENSAGALGLHDNPRMQYLRPELIGFVLGALASAGAFREFRSRGGSAPLPRLVSGIFLIVGCAVFIGCPIKLFLRFTAGDLTALGGVAGLLAGVWIGLKGLARGVHLGRHHEERGGSGLLVPGFFLLLLVFLLARPGFLIFSGRGSAAQHAPWLLALGAGLALGALAQRSRFCITGSVRDTLLMGRRSPLLWGLLAFVGAAVAFNAATGRFNPGLYGQPGAHLEHLWSFLGMALVGWISVLIGGCPFRQLVKAGEGDADAGLVVVGMFIGGGLVQSWGIAATAAGVSLAGKAAVLLGFVFVLLSCLLFRERASA